MHCIDVWNFEGSSDSAGTEVKMTFISNITTAQGLHVFNQHGQSHGRLGLSTELNMSNSH